MTKLQLLHRALNERLMAAVEQIMEMVGGTVLEYEEETVRARKENEILRRRLRWMEGENPTDWPDPTDFSIPGETSLTDALAIESLIIKTEPIDSHDFQLYGPDTSLTASVCTASMEMVCPGTSASADAGIPDGIIWDSAQSYMAPLDFDPTPSTMARNRNQRKSFACPECGKVFGREQRLMFHMRVHSTERPYTYRRRKACFYGDKKQKRKLRGLSKTSREFIEDLSDTSEQTEQSAVSANVRISTSACPSAPELEPSEASDDASEHTSSSSSSKLSDTSSSRPVGLKAKQGREKPKTAQCLQCNKAFTNVSRLAVHMKTHQKSFSSQDEQNVQGDTDRGDSGSQLLTKVIRNNETEVEKAKAIGQKLFQCPECTKIFARSCWLSFHLKSHERERKRQKKKQLQNNKLKDTPKLLEKPKKVVAADSKVHVLKKIFACPYCDKVFAREGWLGPHIRSHTNTNHNSDIISDAILPNSTKRSSRRVTKPSRERGSKRKKLAEQSLGTTESSKRVTEKTINETPVSQNSTLELGTNPEVIITNNTDDTSNESQSISSATETFANKITDESPPVPEESSPDAKEWTPVPEEWTPVPEESTPVPKESTPVPEESSGQKASDKKAKKRFPCRECGKVYLLAGWLKTHKKMHKNERILEENRRQLLMMKEFGQDSNKETGQSLVAKNVRKKQKKKKTDVGLQGSPDNKKKKKSQLTNAVLLETMDKSSDTEPASDKSKESGGATSRKCVCKDCGKVYARKNWLSLHMLGHRKALMALPQKANDEKPNSDSQVTQEGSSTEDQKGQKGKDGSKATFPCPFCDKVFPRAMRLMVHMQIHSGEKPYSYRQRKGQFYAEPTRPRVPDTEKQEPAIEGNDEQGKDEGGDVTRSQTSPDQTSTAELLETGQPQSVCAGRQFNLLPLQSSDAATIQSMALTRTESKSDSNFSLQPRIVLDPVMAEASHSPSSERGDFKPVNVETYDIQLHQTPELESSDAATGGQVKSRLHQTPNPHTSQIPLAEADDPDIVCVTVGSADKYHEHTSCPETLFVSLRDQHSSDCPESNKSEILKEDCRVDSRDLIDGKQHKVCRGPQLLEMDIESQPSGSQIYTHGKTKFLGVLKPNNIPPHFEYLKCSVAGAYISDQISTDKALATDPVYESSSSAVQHLAHSESGYMLLSDVSDDDDCADVSNNSDDDKKKEMTNSMPLQEASADARAALGFPHKASDSDVTVMLEKTDEQSVHDGTLANRDELAEMTVQQAEEASSTGQARWFTCMVCDLTFAGEATLTQHMQVHAVSTGTYPKSNAFKTLKKRVKNNETKPKQEVQTSEVGSAESKDSCEISGNGDPTLRNISTDFGATSRSKTVDRKSTKEKDTQCCCYCEKACGNIELHDHLMHDHPQQPKVMEALNCCNNFEERKRLLSLLCRSKERKTSRNKTDGDLVRCIFCQGYYRRYHFGEHALICKQKQPEEFTETEPGSNIVLPNTSLKLRHSLAKKGFYPESGNLIKDVFCNTVLQTTAESVKLPSAEAEHYTTHYLCSVSTDLEPGTTNVNPGHGLASPPVLYSNNSSAMNLDSKSSGPLILDSSWPGAVENAFAKNQKVTLKTKGLLKNEHQSTIEPENRLHNILQHHTSVSSSSYLLHATCSNLHQDTDKDKDCRRATAQALDYSGEPVTQIHTGGCDSQLSTNVKSDWTIRPTVYVGMEKHLVSNKEPDTILTMPELRSDRSTQRNRHSESTGCPVASLSSSKAQDAANKYPKVESRCRLIPSLIPRAKQHDTDSEKQFDSEGHISDGAEECSTCTGKDSDFKLPGVNSAATIKRRWDSGSGDTKRRRQSDPLQTKGQQLLSDPDSQSNLTTHTSLVGNDDIKRKTSCSSPADDWSKTAISTDDEQDSQNGLSVVNRRRRSSRIHARPMKLTHSPSDEAERTSQRSKPHVCQHCNASFCTPYNLRRHLYTHTSERPFWCSECNMGFIQKYRYRNHRMIHHVTEDLRTFHAE